MAAKIETQDDKLDGLKWAAASLVLIGGLGGFYYFADQSLLLRVVAMLVVVGISTAIALQTVKGRGAWEFMKDARTEVRKVVWPTRKETIQTTLIVMAVVAILSIFLWLLDMLLAWGIHAIIGGS